MSLGGAGLYPRGSCSSRGRRSRGFAQTTRDTIGPQGRSGRLAGTKQGWPSRARAGSPSVSASRRLDRNLGRSVAPDSTRLRAGSGPAQGRLRRSVFLSPDSTETSASAPRRGDAALLSKLQWPALPADLHLPVLYSGPARPGRTGPVRCARLA